MVIMNKTDGLFFLVLLVMRITYGTWIKNLIFLLMDREVRPKNQTDGTAHGLPSEPPREGRNAHEMPHG